MPLQVKHFTDLAAKKKYLAELKSGQTLVIPFIARPLKVGDIGLSPDPVGFLFQIIGDQEMLVELSWAKNSPKMVLVRGVPTAGRIDKTAVTLDGVFEVSGTEKYNTATGSNTVMVLEPFDVKGAEELVPKAVDGKKKPRK